MSNIVNQFMNKYNISKDMISKYWNKAKLIASNKLSPDDAKYIPLVMSVMSQLIQVNASYTSDELMELVDTGLIPMGPITAPSKKELEKLLRELGLHPANK